MLIFVIVAALMIAVCLGLALVPMWRAQMAERGDRRRSANIELYRQRTDELDHDIAAGRVSREEGEAEREALGARLLADVDAGDSLFAYARDHETGIGQRPWVASALAGGLIIFLGSAGYYMLGTPQAIDDSGMPNVTQMIDALRSHINQDPNDRGARLMLSEAYRNQGEFAKAAAQLHAINAASSPPDASLLVAEAQDRLSAGQTLEGQVGDLFQQALVQDPDNIQALWFLGLRASQENRPKAAVRFWDRLLSQDLPPKVRSMVKARRNSLSGDVPSL